MVAALTSLEFLRLDQVGLMPGELRRLSCLTLLSRLRLSACEVPVDDFHDGFVPVLAELDTVSARLRVLQIDGSSQIAEVPPLRCLTGLVALNLRGCSLRVSGLPTEVLQLLGSCSALDLGCNRSLLHPDIKEDLAELCYCVAVLCSQLVVLGLDVSANVEHSALHTSVAAIFEEEFEGADSKPELVVSGRVPSTDVDYQWDENIV